MKTRDKFLTALLILAAIGFVTFIVIIAVKDAKNETGAFRKSADVYPLTAAYKGPVTTNLAVYRDEPETAEDFTEPEPETEICTVLETEETNEPTTAEETEPVPVATVCEAEPETVEAPTTEPSTVAADCPCQAGAQYIVAGVSCPKEVSDYLKAELDARGIGWWLPYGLCAMKQESNFRTNAVSANGMDQGILQYRAKYWNTAAMGDIFDYRAQIRRYAEQTANRLNAGCSIDETISRHMMSDWGDYNPKYVGDVLQWFDKIQEVE